MCSVLTIVLFGYSVMLYYTILLLLSSYLSATFQLKSHLVVWLWYMDLGLCICSFVCSNSHLPYLLFAMAICRIIHGYAWRGVWKNAGFCWKVWILPHEFEGWWFWFRYPTEFTHPCEKRACLYWPLIWAIIYSFTKLRRCTWFNELFIS